MVHYLSHDVQNEFIEIAGDFVRQTILTELKRNKYFSVIVDATADEAQTEQNVFILRYVSLEEQNQYRIRERFLDFVECFNKTGHSIAKMICDELQRYGLQLSDCRGQGYDNGTNMSGIYQGAQALILKENPLAIFSPCGAHSLNLCGVHAVESCADAVTFFGIVSKTYNFFHSSPQRWKVLKENIGSSLHGLSGTRWSARIDAVRPFAKHLPGLQKAVELASNFNMTADARTELKGIQKYLKSFQCVLMSSVWYKVLAAINLRNVVLQAREATIEVESTNVKSLVEELNKLRNSWDTIYAESCKVAENIGISPNLNVTIRGTEIRKGKRKCFIDETPEEDLNLSPEDSFKLNVFNVILDTVVGNLTIRYAAIDNMMDTFGFLWNYVSLDDSTLSERVENMASLYSVDVNKQDLKEEILQLKIFMQLILGLNHLALCVFSMLFKSAISIIFFQI